MKKLIFSFCTFIIFSILHTSNVNAQEVACSWNGSSCSVSGHTCGSNAAAVAICSSKKDLASCNSKFSCGTSGAPPAPAVTSGGVSCTWNGSTCLVASHNCGSGATAAAICTSKKSQADCNSKFSCGSSNTGAAPAYTCDNGNGIDTAIGCIPISDQTALFGFFFKWGLGIAGGIAFLLIIIATFQIMTSSGDPKKMQAGKELLTAAISGVVLLIFSVFILRIIAGPSLLNIPFFS